MFRQGAPQKIRRECYIILQDQSEPQAGFKLSAGAGGLIRQDMQAPVIEGSRALAGSLLPEGAKVVDSGNLIQLGAKQEPLPLRLRVQPAIADHAIDLF